MQVHCMHVKKCSDFAYPHLPMCFKYIKRGPNGCVKGTSCKCVHPKLCRASLVSGKCDCNRGYFYHVTGSARSNHMYVTSNPAPPHKMHGPNYHPTPLMQVSVPHPMFPNLSLTQHRLILFYPLSKLPYQTPTSSYYFFIEELKDIKSQMLQMQQTQNLLMLNIMNQI